jgi:hypothetical protein
MTSAGATPLLWWFDLIDRKDLYWHYRALADFARGEDRRDPGFRMRAVAFEKTPPGTELAALAYMAGRRGYAWVYAVGPMMRYPAKPVTVSGVRVRLDELERGTWAVEFWDTVRGEIAKGMLVETQGASLRLDMPAFDNDMAMKLRRTERLKARGR